MFDHPSKDMIVLDSIHFGNCIDIIEILYCNTTSDLNVRSLDNSSVFIPFASSSALTFQGLNPAPERL